MKPNKYTQNEYLLISKANYVSVPLAGTPGSLSLPYKRFQS